MVGASYCSSSLIKMIMSLVNNFDPEKIWPDFLSAKEQESCYFPENTPPVLSLQTPAPSD